MLLSQDGIYLSATGTGFSIVVEGRGPVGLSLFDPVAGPDLQVQVSQGLGNENPEVCGMFQDGVPARGAGDFNPSPHVINALNDFACRFEAHTNSADGCLHIGGGVFGFGSLLSTVQFCSTLTGPALRFHGGDTLVSVRLRDAAGNFSRVSSLVVRVGAPPTPTPTPSGGTSPTATRTAAPTAPAATATAPPSATPTHTSTPEIPSPTSTPTATSAATPAASRCDVDHSGLVDDDDLAAVLTAIFETPNLEAADLDGLPGVTAADVTALLRLLIQGCE